MQSSKEPHLAREPYVPEPCSEALSDEELEQIVTVWTRKPRRIVV